MPTIVQAIYQSMSYTIVA